MEFDKFRIRTKIYANKQSMELLKEVSGSRAFIVCDSIIEKLGFLKMISDYLNEAGICSSAFTGLHPDPDVKVIADGMKAYLDFNPDVLVAIGGGSAIDTAKGILYSVWQLEKSRGEFQKPQFIAIPSTSGTGSEVTNFSIITADDKKVCLIDDLIAPDIAILDSTCIENLPQKVVADTGIDVLVHAIESYVSINATDFTDALAEKTIKLLFEYLPKLYSDVSDPIARDKVQNASCMAGMAFTNAGLGINHSLAHALGAEFHIAHGRANALLLDNVIDYNANLSGQGISHAAERYAKLAETLALPARTSREGAVSFMLAVKNLKKTLGASESIRALGISETDFQAAVGKMAESAMADRCTPTSPKQPTKEELMCLYQKTY